MDYDVIIVGGGVAGLSAAGELIKRGRSVLVIEAESEAGGKIRTERHDGYLLDRGFQVLQTGYPEAVRQLDFEELQLRKFPAGVVVRFKGKFHTVANPLLHPRYLLSTTFSPIGSVKDRLLMAKLAREVAQTDFEALFDQPEQPTIEYLQGFGFSSQFISSFFMPFFAGACLDRTMQTSSRVLRYIIRLFAAGDAALPARGMRAIPDQLVRRLPESAIRYNAKVVKVAQTNVLLEEGEQLSAKNVILATEWNTTAQLLGQERVPEMGESCVYFTTSWKPPFRHPFLVLNGEGAGPINNLAFPNMVASEYGPPGQTLISTVVLEKHYRQSPTLVDQVREQLSQWFSVDTSEWNHLRTYHINAALPRQHPPTSSPYATKEEPATGVVVCGDYQSLPGLQWSLMSGRLAAEQVDGR